MDLLLIYGVVLTLLANHGRSQMLRLQRICLSRHGHKLLNLLHLLYLLRGIAYCGATLRSATLIQRALGLGLVVKNFANLLRVQAQVLQSLDLLGSH
jgi:hypothetical protein